MKRELSSLDWEKNAFGLIEFLNLLVGVSRMIKSVKFGLIEFLNLLVGVSRMIKSAFFSQSSDDILETGCPFRN